MDIGLKDKVAIVTGAGRGIGAAVARKLARHGAAVVVNYVRVRETAEAVAESIRKEGGKAIAHQADVRDAGAVEEMVKKTVGEFGRLDVLVCNANIDFPMKPFAEFSWDELEAKFLGEMKAMFHPVKAVLPDMIKRGSGRLIFVSSGLSRHPGYGFSAHCAAKAAMDSLCRVMALELGPYKITANVVGPGLTLTDATSGLPAEVHEMAAKAAPLGRVGMPEDVSGAVAFLASSLSDFITGEYIPVNGGSFML